MHGFMCVCVALLSDSQAHYLFNEFFWFSLFSVFFLNEFLLSTFPFIRWTLMGFCNQFTIKGTQIQDALVQN